ncbi:kinesin family-like [Eucyclogobius newberryi]|uniref:kinesin family-like n=1 Tax=Eucyclogobius newberryi TaxID=166745 RepID=UPI003B5CD2EE
MYMNPAGAHRGYTLTYLGKKVGRNHAVAPAGKQLAWETTCPTSDEPGVSPRPVCVAATAAVLEELPGSVPERREEQPQVERYRDNRQGREQS